MFHIKISVRSLASTSSKTDYRCKCQFILYNNKNVKTNKIKK